MDHSFITGGASTLSRQPSRRPITNPYSVTAHGCKVELKNGEIIIDYPMGLYGPLFGYAPDYLVRVLDRRFDFHFVTSFPPSIEKEVAKLLNKIIPDATEFRFSKNGSDVTQAAVRLARAVTGRDRIASFGYHGFTTEFAERKPTSGPSTYHHFDQSRGVPQRVLDLVAWFEWGDVTGLRAAAKNAACVIIEVPPTDEYDQTKIFLELCRDIAHDNGALFILDEIVTGFRFALGGAAEFYEVAADLYCYGKAMSNGYACSALGGRAELMQEFQRGVFFSGTFFDDPLGLTATHATLTQLIERIGEVYSHLWLEGTRLKEGFNALAKQHGIEVKCVGQAPRTVFEWKADAMRKRFMEECLKRGVLFDRPNFITMAHTREIVDQSLGVAEEAMMKISDQ